MTKTPQKDIVAGPQAVDVNTSGSDDELTERTAAEMRDICNKTGEPFSGSLTENEARLRISALREAHGLS